MEMIVTPGGEVRCLYDELIDLNALGRPTIIRASHVEPDPEGRWWADLAPVGEPVLTILMRTEDRGHSRACQNPCDQEAWHRDTRFSRTARGSATEATEHDAIDARQESA